MATDGQQTYPKFSQPVWLAARFKSSAAPEIFSRAIERVGHFYRTQAGSQHNLSRSAGLALYSIVPEPPLFGVPLVLAEPDFHACSSHIMPTAVSEGKAGSAQYLRHFASELSGALPPLWKVPPPVAYVYHAIRMDAIYAATDFFGSGRVYYGASPDLDLMSSSQAPIALATEICPETDEDAWASYAAFDWILDDRTFFTGVSVLPPGATARFSNEAAGWVRSHDYASVLNGGAEDSHGTDAVAAGQALIASTAEITSSEPARIGISGGRDSRLVAAMALDLGIDARFDTFWPPKLELDVAEQVVAASPRPMNWINNRFDPEQLPSGDVPFEGNATYWFQLFEGDGWPSNAGRSIPPEATDPDASAYQRWNMADHPGPINRWNLSGQGGEIIRHHFYGTEDLANPGKRLDAFLAYRRRIPLIVSERSREVSAGMLESIMQEGRRIGLSGVHLLDWIYVRSQQRRRVPIAFSPGVAFPLYTPQMFMAGFALPPEEKISSALFTDLTNRIIPEWRDVPYFDELAAGRPLAEVNKTLSRRLYWEGDRNGFLRAMKTGLEPMAEHFQDDAFEAFSSIERSDKRAAQLQNISNRVLWRIGFEDFVRRIRRVQAEVPVATRPLPPEKSLRTWSFPENR